MSKVYKDPIRIAQTDCGQVRGIRANNPRFTVFRGIPYAAPPVGQLRWKRPQPAEPWEGVRECFEFAPITMQKVPGKDPTLSTPRSGIASPRFP